MTPRGCTIGRAAAVVCLFVLLGVLYTYPLVRYLGTGMPYTHAPPPGWEVAERVQGDYLQFYYQLWLFRDALFGPTPPFVNPYEFVWDGPGPGRPTYFLPLSVIYLLLTPLGDFVAYNGLVILSFGLAGAAMFWLAREVVGPGWPALVAGAVFALAPYRYAVLAGGHPAGSAFGLVPLALLGVERAIRTGERGWSVAAGATVFSLALVEPQFLYLVLLLLPPLLLVRLLPPVRSLHGARTGIARRIHDAARALAPLWPLGLLVLATLGLMLYVKACSLDPSIARAGRSLREIGLFSPGPGDWLVRFNENAGRSIYPGVVAVGLAAAGLGASLFRRRSAGATPGRRYVVFLAALFVLAELLSLGPRATFFPLYHALYHAVPYLGFIRLTSKFQLLAVLALALLAGLGVRALTRALAPRRAAAAVVAAILLAAVAVDYWPRRPVGVSLLPTRNEVYRVLRGARAGHVVYVPIWPGDSSWSSLYQFATTLTRRPMVNGYLPLVHRRYVEAVYWPLDHLNRGELGEREYARLRALGVRFVVVDQGAFPSKVSAFPSGFTVRRLMASPYLEPLVADRPLWLLGLRGSPSRSPEPPPTTPYGIFFEAERLQRSAGEVVSDHAASAGRAVRAAAGSGGHRAGHLAFGTHVGLPRGDFRVTFRLRGRGSTEPVATIEAVTELGTRTLAARTLAGHELTDDYRDQTLSLSLPSPETVEFRTYWTGRGEVQLDYLYGHFADQRDPQWLFRDLEFGHESGPFRRYPPGEYVVRFRMRIPAGGDTPIARLTVATARERAVLATRLVRGTEREGDGIAQDIALPFRLDALTVVEFPIDLLAPGVVVDQITVVPADTARQG